MGASTSKAAAAKLFGTGGPTPAPTAPPPEERPPPRKKRSGSKRKKSASPPPNRGNSLGKGFYLYKGGVAKKVSAYLDPDVALGLRMAATSGVDPRGGDMSEIVNTLLKEAGYVADLPPGYLDGLIGG